MSASLAGDKANVSQNHKETKRMYAIFQAAPSHPAARQNWK